MNIEEIREYCLSMPLATEDQAFGPDNVLFRVCNKIFGCIDLNCSDRIVVKCDADYAAALREHHCEIEPAWHWNKRYWIQIDLQGSLPDETIRSLIRHSYTQVVGGLPRRERLAHPEILSIDDTPPNP